ncbi:ATP-binding protein [Acidomonas methanolica]|uniref:ATP-binding protein n=1 Tax=Acidomonas methanolica TaxID=437 RepID=UPI00211A8A14|nr:ATP-binding protein [Acidomonas methanolica]
MTAFKAIYVTGAPASGKSSTMAMLKKRIPELNVWEYGARLTSFLQERGAALTNQDELRSLSAGMATPADINALDDQLLAWIRHNRQTGHSVVDSHSVTKEEYGFRVTAFSAERFRQLAPDEIWLFYVEPEITSERIARNAAGRPMISLEEARIHNASQASVACTYGVVSGCPVYMFDTNVDQEKLVDRLARRLKNRNLAEQEEFRNAAS